MHPSRDIIGTYGDYLEGIKIALCVTGSVAAYKAVDLARQLMRYGAEVIPFMSYAATKIISPELLHWATANKPIVELTGAIEHVIYGGESENKVDLILIYPSTANTLAKIANGIADTSVTTLALTALGSGIPIIIVPAMHLPLYKGPTTQENIERLRSMGIDVLEPTIEEGKAKIPQIDYVVDYVLTKIAKSRGIFKNKKALILGGPTIEYIDPVRIITNLSSGRTGLYLAKVFRWMGGEAKLICGPGSIEIPNYISHINVYTTNEMYKTTMEELKNEEYDYVFISAAPADYKPVKQVNEKLSTKKVKRLKLELVETEKISDMVKDVSPNSYLVIFKAEYNVPEKELIERAYQKLRDANADLVVANDVSGRERGFRSAKNEVYIIDKEKNVVHIPLSSKEYIARRLLEIVAEKTIKN